MTDPLTFVMIVAARPRRVVGVPDPGTTCHARGPDRRPAPPVTALGSVDSLMTSGVKTHRDLLSEFLT